MYIPIFSYMYAYICIYIYMSVIAMEIRLSKTPHETNSFRHLLLLSHKKLNINFFTYASMPN